MLQIKAKKINCENFSKFGSFYNMIKPEGYSLNGEIHKFFPDRFTTCCPNKNLAFSPILVKKQNTMIVKQIEYHTTTCEIIMPINDDMIIHVAPASAGTPVTNLTEAFIVPKNTIVKINTAIWHLAPLPVNSDELCAMIILPECTYANDCTVANLTDEQQFQINL